MISFVVVLRHSIENRSKNVKKTSNLLHEPMLLVRGLILPKYCYFFGLMGCARFERYFSKMSSSFSFREKSLHLQVRVLREKME